MWTSEGAGSAYSTLRGNVHGKYKPRSHTTAGVSHSNPYGTITRSTMYSVHGNQVGGAAPTAAAAAGQAGSGNNALIVDQPGDAANPTLPPAMLSVYSEAQSGSYCSSMRFLMYQGLASLARWPRVHSDHLYVTCLGDPDAMYQMALFYDNPPPPHVRDSSLTAKWYKLAAARGHIQACVSLGACYTTGTMQCPLLQ